MSVKVIFFDVNETLLDLGLIRQSVSKVLGANHYLVELWFSRLLHLSLVYSAGNTFKPFGSLAQDALMQVAAAHNYNLGPNQASEAIKPITRCKPHDDVAKALEQLKNKSVVLCTLTNSSADALEQQMQNANLQNYFEQHISVEEFGIYKPNQQVYRQAAEQLSTHPTDCMMVAAHDWDIFGAARSGFQTVYLQRKAAKLYGFDDPKPDFIINELGSILDII